jgi:ribosomal-protein-alanine acetyltransferase
MEHHNSNFDRASYTIRALTGADTPNILELQKTYNLSYWSSEDYQKHIEQGDTINLAALYKNKLIGFIISRLIISNEIGNVQVLPGKIQKINYTKFTEVVSFAEAEIFNIAVHKNFRREGIGTFLIRKVIELCRELNVNSIWLEVRETNFDAVKFYQFHDFKEIYSRKNYYYSPSENATVMKLDLVGTQQK